VGHLPEHLTGLVEIDLSWQSRTRGVGVPTEVQDLAFFAGSTRGVGVPTEVQDLAFFAGSFYFT
jgi:hypothetical protein